MNFKIIILIGAFILISIIDLAANVLSILPVVGGFFESLSEMFLEGLQIIFVIIIALIAGRDK